MQIHNQCTSIKNSHSVAAIFHFLIPWRDANPDRLLLMRMRWPLRHATSCLYYILWYWKHQRKFTIKYVNKKASKSNERKTQKDKSSPKMSAITELWKVSRRQDCWAIVFFLLSLLSSFLSLFAKHFLLVYSTQKISRKTEMIIWKNRVAHPWFV
jgi:hypothetical protein